MNERIKELAEEFAMHTETMTGVETEYIFDLEDLERFADLVRQDERERLKQEFKKELEKMLMEMYDKGVADGLNSIAAAIRGRTE